ncbi:hypothetical protein CEXT_298741 [Caerostris extrusa]|uniref:Uncharacterized protein n=1 Tax=Caerostris extrusa TaxID=172846 RepID=A0AAV4QYT0_CAEEX|nr:hypothetical protein CEXT_298741 [Caerostris extrusa]
MLPNACTKRITCIRRNPGKILDVTSRPRPRGAKCLTAHYYCAERVTYGCKHCLAVYGTLTVPTSAPDDSRSPEPAICFSDVLCRREIEREKLTLNELLRSQLRKRESEREKLKFRELTPTLSVTDVAMQLEHVKEA